MRNRTGLTRRSLGKALAASGAAALVSSSPFLRGAEAKAAAPAARPLSREQKKDLAKALADTAKTLNKLRARDLDESVAPAFAIAIPEERRP